MLAIEKKDKDVIEALSRRMNELAAIKKYVTAGRAIFTLRSKKSGKRYTFKVTAIDMRYGHTNNFTHFVSVMSGPDNEASYSYLGMLDLSWNLNATRKSLRGKSFEVAQWFFEVQLKYKKSMEPSLEFWHSGRCCRCGKKLTVPESIASGIGPDCATKM